MFRFLCCTTFLFLVTFPLFAQDDLMPPEPRPLPRGNESMLQRMRQQLTVELQQIQRMIGSINPNDTQFLNLLKAQQAELTKQMRDIAQQLGGFEGSDSEPAAVPEAQKSAQSPAETAPETELPGRMSPFPPDNRMPTGMMPMNPPYTEMPPYMPGMMGGMPASPALDSSPWAPKPSKELLEVKQSVESLRTDISGLKEIVKNLETQIQLLNRNILLLEKSKE